MSTELSAKEFYMRHICILPVDWLNRFVLTSLRILSKEYHPNKLLKYSKLWSNILPSRGLWQEKTLGNKQLSSKEEYRTWKEEKTRIKIGGKFLYRRDTVLFTDVPFTQRRSAAQFWAELYTAV